LLTNPLPHAWEKGGPARKRAEEKNPKKGEVERKGSWLKTPTCLLMKGNGERKGRESKEFVGVSANPSRTKNVNLFLEGVRRTAEKRKKTLQDEKRGKRRTDEQVNKPHEK